MRVIFCVSFWLMPLNSTADISVELDSLFGNGTECMLWNIF